MNGDFVPIVAVLAIVVAGYVVTELYALRETAPRRNDDEVHADAARQMAEILAAECDATNAAYRAKLADRLYASEQGKEPLP